MEMWRKVWREGIKPLMSPEALSLLRDRLERDDVQLLQGATTTPPPLQCLQDWSVEAACPIATRDLDTPSSIGEIEEFFARVCHECGQRLGEPAAVRYFINWWDETPRSEAVKALLEECQ